MLISNYFKVEPDEFLIEKEGVNIINNGSNYVSSNEHIGDIVNQSKREIENHDKLIMAKDEIISSLKITLGIKASEIIELKKLLEKTKK